jgi:hypothetical protein
MIFLFIIFYLLADADSELIWLPTTDVAGANTGLL